MPSHYPKVTSNYRANDDKPCLQCGVNVHGFYPHCPKCKIERLECLIDSKNGHEFSEGSKDMMRQEIEELRRVKL